MSETLYDISPYRAASICAPCRSTTVPQSIPEAAVLRSTDCEMIIPRQPSNAAAEDLERFRDKHKPYIPDLEWR